MRGGLTRRGAAPKVRSPDARSGSARFLLPRLRFPTSNDVENKVEEQTEIAASMSVKKPLSFELFDLDRIGLALRFGGGVQGVSLFFSLRY